MATQRQIDANRENARGNKGPTTPTGKAASSRNAVTHGLTSRSIYLQGEDPAHLLEIRRRLWQELEPCGIIEEELAERLVGLLWRLRRVPALEATLFSWIASEQTDGSGGGGEDPTLEQTQFTWGRTIAATLGKTDFLFRLTRYEVQIANQLQRSLVEFERRKAQRNKA